MGVSPFFATQGYDPLIAVHLDVEITNLCTHHFAVNFNKMNKFLHDQMQDT